MADKDNPIRRIVSRFGSTAALGRQIGSGQSTVSDWCIKGFVPASRIEDVINAGLRMDPPIILEPNDFFSISAPTALEASDFLSICFDGQEP
jgi:hypothetical protein